MHIGYKTNRNGSWILWRTSTRPWPSRKPSFSSTRGGRSTGSLRRWRKRTSPFLLWYLLLYSPLNILGPSVCSSPLIFFLLAWRNGSEGQRFDHEGVPVRLQSSPHHHRPARMYNNEPLFALCLFSPLVTCFNATKYASKLDAIRFVPLLVSLQLQCYNLRRENQFLVVLLLPKVPSPPICCASEGLIVPW